MQLQSTSEIVHLLNQRGLFKALDERTQANLVSISNVLHLEDNQNLFCKGDVADGVYIIIEGTVRIEIISFNGKTVHLATLGKGSVFGELAVLDKRGRTADARACGPAAILKIDDKNFLSLAETNSAFSFALLNDVVEKLRCTDLQIENRAFLPLIGRISHFLLSYTTAASMPNKIHMTQAEIAERLGASREKVNTRLQELQRNGGIFLSRGLIIIKNPNILKNYIQQ